VSSFTVTEKETLVTIHCASCHMMFAITKDFEERRRSDRHEFYCPSGHNQWFEGITDAERAKRAEEKAKRAEARAAAIRDQLDASERSNRALKGVATKLKAKVEKAEAGVCPHCHRSFQDLRRHMLSKHRHDDED